MATKKTKQAAKPKKSTVSTNKIGIFARIWQFAKDNPVLAFLIVVLICGVIYGSIYLFERWQFSTAEKKLDSVASAIVEELGQPTSIEKNKSCSYRSTVFEDQRGLPACGISYTLKFDTTDIEKAFSITESILSNASSIVDLSIQKNIDIDKDLNRPTNRSYGLFNVAYLECDLSINIDESYTNSSVIILAECNKNNTLSKPYPVN